MPIYYKKVDNDSVRVIDPRSSPRRPGSLSKHYLSLFPSRSEAILSPANESDFPLISCPDDDQTLAPHEERVTTSCGSILIAHQGADLREKKPIIITFHDLGLNYASNFEQFFDLTENRLLLQSFSAIHITAPGQEKHASRFYPDFKYPTMDQLAVCVKEIADHFGVKTFIGIGCGAGSNILIRTALAWPDLVEGLFLINPSVGKALWSEWFYQKKNIRELQNNQRSSLIPKSVQDYLMWYHFGPASEERVEGAGEIMAGFKSFFRGIQLNPYNLSLFIESYIERSDLKLSRDNPDRQLKCITAIVCGSLSNQTAIEESVSTNSRLDPSRTTWMKLSDSGMVLEEIPYKVSQSFRLFLQGLGHTLKTYERRRALMSGASLPCIASTTPAATPNLIRRCTVFDIDIGQL